MKFDLNKSFEILSKTPKVLELLLSGLSDDWILNNEGQNTWSPFDVIGHLIHGEKTDWIPRAKIILSQKENKTFEPFDRFAQKQASANKSMIDLLKEFRELRTVNLSILNSLDLDEKDLTKKGIHPDLGESSLKELLSTWVVHDLGHITQISRVMAKQLKSEVGPWEAYLTILK